MNMPSDWNELAQVIKEALRAMHLKGDVVV